MTVSVEWDHVEQKILRYTISGTWTWAELDEVYQTGAALTHGITGRYDVIMDVSGIHILPLDAFHHARKRYPPRKPTDGVTVVVGANPMVMAILKMLSLLAPREFLHYRYSATLEDAYQLIQKNRAKGG